MKGIVFSEFNEMVEEMFSPALADKIIMRSDLASGGAYTTVGTYDHRELLTLVACLSEETGIAASNLIKTFGRHLAARFTALYPAFFEGIGGTLDFLETIEQHVHVEVRKLYPDAELPTFSTERTGADSMTMVYRSRRPFADLAEGLIEGCASHFAERIAIERSDSAAGELHSTRFTLSRID
ncbi:MAG: heme NO-binding domain-containing protein [Chromatiales bacterium]|nr:heme NO-binding domain-containing protein [Chromatiales bacterium]